MPRNSRGEYRSLLKESLNWGNKIIAMIKISSDIPGRIKVGFSYNPEYISQDQDGQGSPVAS